MKCDADAKAGEQFPNLPANKNISEWGFEPVCAQCYLGSTGIAAAFAGGAVKSHVGSIAEPKADLLLGYRPVRPRCGCESNYRCRHVVAWVESR